jgi:YbgC/YbaW family acyl-CoA thioester hydrolase
MAHEFRSTRQVEFHETDMAGMVHFAVFFTWMEEVEHAFMRSLDITVFHTDRGRVFTWPRVAASCEYVRPVRLTDTIEQHLRVERRGTKSLTYGVTFYHEGAVCARGQVTAVCCVRGENDTYASTELPAFVLERIEQAPDVDPTSRPDAEGVSR